MQQRGSPGRGVDVERVMQRAMAAYQSGDFVAAERDCGTALAADATRPDAWMIRGVLHVRQNQVAEAEACYRRAVDLAPGFLAAWFNLGNLYRRTERMEQALTVYQHCVALHPGYAEAYDQIAQIHSRTNNLRKSIEVYRRAVELAPDAPDICNNFGKILWEIGRVEEAADMFRRAVLHTPDHAGFHSNLLVILQFLPGQTGETLLTEHQEWCRRHADPVAVASHVPDGRSRDPERVLRIGYVSSTFVVRDAAGASIYPVITHHDRSRYEIYCYATLAREDSMTHLLKGCSHWRQVEHLSDPEFCALVRQDRIDILVDLNGHTMANRLLAFARRPAPIQMTWLGYEGTTGLPAMDYIISDRQLSPEAHQAYYTEQILRMPYGYACYEPAGDAPLPVATVPALRNGYVTFGSFNKLAKLNRSVVTLWAGILRRVPTSRLRIKWRWATDQAARDYIGELFASAGVDAGRLQFSDHSSYTEMMQEYGEVDIALDPFPFSGGATTCDALWMGVPVVTLRGTRHASNHTASHLISVGFPEWIAGTPGEYLNIAIGLAGNPRRLQTLRGAIRPLMQRSPLCNGRLFAAHLERLYRMAWQEHGR